jgi:hypothetical protein
MEIDREITDLGHRLKDIEKQIDYIRDCTEAELAKCEQAIDDRIAYNSYYGRFNQPLFLTVDRGFYWEWKPAKKEFRDYKLNKMQSLKIKSRLK